jgi:hypothetical protein
MLVEILAKLGDLSAKVTTVLSDMAYIKEDVTEHKHEIRALSAIPERVTRMETEWQAAKADLEARIRSLERDKMPKAMVGLIATVAMAIIGMLAYLGVTVK